jgi:hypothetical protein
MGGKSRLSLMALWALALTTGSTSSGCAGTDRPAKQSAIPTMYFIVTFPPRWDGFCNGRAGQGPGTRGYSSLTFGQCVFPRFASALSVPQRLGKSVSVQEFLIASWYDAARSTLGAG